MAWLAMAVVGAAEPVAAPGVPGSAVIRRAVGDSEIVITTTSRLAGAIHSLTWGGREFVDSHDHGRQLQSASNLDVNGTLTNECFNPTEAGSERDMAGPTSTSRLLYLSAGDRELVTATQMAFWLRPGQTSGGQAALNTTALSNHLLEKHVRIGVDGLDHAISHAMGAWSPAVSRTTGRPATYGRFAFPAQKVVKWNCVVREEDQDGLAAGSHRFLVYSAVGTREQVRETLVAVRTRTTATARNPGGLTPR